MTLTAAGQNKTDSDKCIACFADGKPCNLIRPVDNIPYCASHMATGDPSLKVFNHPRVGKSLAAARDLPKGYKIAWWGKRKNSVKGKKTEWALETDMGTVDATDYEGSLLQFCPCPGPTEYGVLQFAHSSKKFMGDGKDRGGKQVSVMFTLKEDVPKNTQLTMMYCSSPKEAREFFAERGIKMVNVGTEKYPAPTEHRD